MPIFDFYFEIYSGWKHSGIGIEVSEHALYEYLNLKHIRIRL